MMSKTLHRIGKAFKIIFLLFGATSVIALVLALTPAPFYMHYALGNDPGCATDEPFHPDRIVMFGGAGMPSESNLIRLYYTAEYALRYPAPVLIVHPEDSVCKAEMTRFLVRSGIPEHRITFMEKGSNTRSQALELARSDAQLLDDNLLVVTATEHLRRTVKTLQKAGFTQVRGVAAREATVDFDLSLRGKELDGNTAVPTVRSTNLRYTFWNYLQLEIICLREYFALGYYKIKGWI